jgi:hypothetical protein
VTLTLKIETEEISEMLVFNSTLTQLIAQEVCSTVICQESFKSYVMKCEGLSLLSSEPVSGLSHAPVNSRAHIGNSYA